MLLALDTSTRLAGIALYTGRDGLVAEYVWHSANRHTVELMPRVAQMLEQAGVTRADLKAVAVALGPGSFTGLRVALAAAKGLALASDLVLIGVPTLDAVAYPHSQQSMPVIATVQAGRGRVCWAPYDHGPTGWAAASSYGLATIPALAETISRPTLVAGELTADARAQLAALSGGQAILLPPALAIRRPGCVAEIGWSRYAAGERDDLASLSPIYLHEPAL
jgi:tRNA threonylcarbamoyladenosine biosynthesis protein TsaB